MSGSNRACIELFVERVVLSWDEEMADRMGSLLGFAAYIDNRSRR